VDIKNLFSDSARQLKSSKIRELMKMANTPGIISMAGGMPDSESFPFDEIKNIINSWPYSRAKIALQYGTTRGYTPLIDGVAQWMKEEKKIGMENQEIIITTGSQQALALVSKIFLDPNDVVLVEIPSFIGAIASFYSFMGTIIGVGMDEAGILPDELEKKIKEVKQTGRPVKLIYTIPNFNNPSGITLSSDRRKQILDISYTYGIPLVEDDPYGELYYEGTAREYTPIKSIDERGTVCYLGTFSKVLSPGIRVGWIVANREIVAKLELQKQSFDACTSTLSQLIAHDYLKNGYIAHYTEKMK
jgi:2-aminoadipate transaminase